MASSSSPVLVIDNGGDTCKIGFAGQSQPTRLIPNYAVKPKRERRLFVADQIDQIVDFSSLYYRRPVEKGFITNWDVQKSVWGRVFGKNLLNVDTKASTLLMTEPMFNPKSIQRSMDETVFETYQFQAYHRTTTPGLALKGHQHDTGTQFGHRCAVVIDAGYSSTNIVPLFDGTPLNYAAKRINVGGKLLTNYLKEVVSYRAWNMMDETHTMDDIKKKLCYVSLDFKQDMTDSRRKRVRREYVLPNGSTRLTGYVKDDRSSAETEDQTLKLTNERVSVPEVLFNPSDVGVDQVGIAEAIIEAINATHPLLHGLFYSNILLTGGSTLFPNFAKRVRQELRQLVPTEFNVVVQHASQPLQAAWVGGSILASNRGDNANFTKQCVTRKDYEEYGQELCMRKFFHS